MGKGLGSLMSEATSEAAVAAESSVAISKIKANAGQPRTSFDEAELSELADSIAQNGIIQPLLVRKSGDVYEIVAGERRYRAAKMAGLTEVPVVVREVSDEDIFRLAMIENLQRSNLNPIEEARGYRTLLEAGGLTQEELAKAVSKSRSAVANTMRLLDLPTEIQDMVIEGKLTAGHARAILAVPSEEAQIRLAEKVVADRLSVRQTENLVPLYSQGETEKPARTPMPQSYKRAARALKDIFNSNVKVRNVRGKNRIEIEFDDEDDLVRIVNLVSKGD